MLQVVDCDGHVEESEVTFSEKYWDPKYAGRRPMVVESDEMGNLSFMIDSHAFPRLSGPKSATGGNPVSKDGIPSPQYQQFFAALSKQKTRSSLESMEFRSAAVRLEQNARERIGLQVNFPSALLTWPIAHDPKIGCAVARSYNNWMADISSPAPDRLKWVTVIDPGDVQESCREIWRTKEMGSVGLMLLGTVGDKQLDDPDLEPIWSTVAELDMPVAVHVGFSCPGLDEMYFNIRDAMAVPFSFSQLLGFYAIVRSGLLDRYPKLRVGFMENGARWVDYLVKRFGEFSLKPSQRTPMNRVVKEIQRNVVDEAKIGGAGFRPNPYKSELMPEEYIRRGQIFVQAEVDEEQLPFIVDQYGDDFLLYASDIPHDDHRIAEPIEVLMGRKDLSQETKRKMLLDNGARFYGLSVPEQVPQSELISIGD